MLSPTFLSLVASAVWCLPPATTSTSGVRCASSPGAVPFLLCFASYNSSLLHALLFSVFGIFQKLAAFFRLKIDWSFDETL